MKIIHFYILSHFPAFFDISSHSKAGSLFSIITYNFSLVFKACCYFLVLQLDLLEMLSVPVCIQPDISNAMRLVVSL